MKKLFAYVWDAEPVRLFTIAAMLVHLVASGLVVFDAWHPSADQLAYVEGAFALVAGAFGVTVTRSKVSPFPPPPPEPPQ